MSARSFLLPIGGALVLAATGCGLPLDAAQAIAQNQCSSSADCGDGATCATVRAVQMCVATHANLSGLVLEVRPPANPATATEGAATGTSYLVEPSLSLSGSNSGGHLVTFDLDLPAAARISRGVVVYGGSADPTYELPAPCGGADTSVPADVLFRRAAPHVGLPTAEYVATTEPVLDEMGVVESHQFSAELPPGTYDIYVTPRAPAGCLGLDGEPAKAPPPHFAGRHAIMGGLQNLSIALPETKRLTGTIAVKSSFDIDGWTLAVLEPSSGLEISTVQKIVQPDLISSTKIDLGFHFPLLLESQTGQGPIIRLRPEPPVTSPALYWDLLTADFGNDLDVTLTPGTLDDASRELDVQVLGADGDPVVSTVVLQATSVDGDQNNLSFQLLTETDADGWFHVTVFDGDYQVFARPKVDGPEAIGQTTLSSKANGSSIQLRPKTWVVAKVTTPKGEPLSSAAASAGPSVPEPAKDFLTSALETAPVEPRPDGTSVASGEMTLLLDPGSYDLAVKPAPGTGYPWLVVPRLRILEDDTLSDLGTLDVGYPAVVTGVLRGPDGAPVGGATIRAWIPIAIDQEGTTKTVVQIGEVTTASDGSYVLSLPPSVGG